MSARICGMDMFVVQGGTPLRGAVVVSGAKNAALPMMAASLLARGCTRLQNVPELVDVATLGDVLGELGARVQRQPSGVIEIHNDDEVPTLASYDLVRRMRASVCVLGPLLARRGSATVSLPGGCNIGTRPIDLHLKGLSALGAEIDVRNGYVEARAKQLRGAKIFLAGPHGSTVTGTCNIMSAATLASGTTVIEAAACEPEVVALGEMLIAMGAKISGLGTPKLIIDGVDELVPVCSEVIPDRIEAATLLIAAAATGSELTVSGLAVDDLSAVLEVLREMGVVLEEPSNGTLKVSAPERLRAIDVTARPYPGVPTDVQAQLMALLSLADGTSLVRDLVFPDRFMHVAELNRMGARIRQQGNTAIVQGCSKLTAAGVMACDLRASAALVIAALATPGETFIRRIYHLDRGYERMEAKLTSIGAQVQRVADVTASNPIRENKAG